MPVPEEKFERNEELYHDWSSGMSGVNMVAKYRISSARIYKLIASYKRKLKVDNDNK